MVKRAAVDQCDKSDRTRGGATAGPRVWNRDANEVLAAILKLDSPRQARRFLRDLLTADEIRMVAARWRVAKMLDAGKSYRQIEAQTGLSSRTIARISHWLQRGAGGYRLMTGARRGKTGTSRKDNRR